MSIAVGTRLGPYEIVSPIGAGGMGQVWRARDTRLDRSVAVKVLPAELANDAAFQLRFKREAKTISQLNHPHICTLFDVGENYLVMELMDGEPLFARLAIGPMPIEQVLHYGAQIADALAAAHRAGIVHRDLKPGNVMITKAGAKLLDFGLAKQFGAGPEESTASHPLTAHGSVMGTLPYMAPEHLAGTEADARSDIFALGAVLYEMVTGRRAFIGSSRDEPAPIRELRSQVPPALEQLIAMCLARDPDERIQSAHDVALQLRAIPLRDAPAPPAKRERIPWLIAGAFLAALSVAGYLLLHAPSPAPVRATIDPPPRAKMRDVFAVSPDGRRVVFAATTANSSSLLYLRSLDSLEATPLPGTERAEYVFWSPDGSRIGFRDLTTLKVLTLAGGEIKTIATGIGGMNGGAAWAPDGTILYPQLNGGALSRVSATGGKPAPVAALGGGRLQVYPFFLPDGRHFVFSSLVMLGTEGGVYIGSLDGTAPKKLLEYDSRLDLSWVQYADGHLFYVRDHALFAHQFDLRRLELIGAPIRLQEDISWIAIGRTAFSVANGTLVFLRRGSPLLTQLVWIDRAGRETGRLGEPGAYEEFRLSPDGQKVVATMYDKSLWLVDPFRGASQRLTFSEAAFGPEWIPGAAAVTYGSAEDSPPNIYVRRLDRPAPERLTHSGTQNFPTDVTADGRYIVYIANDPKTFFDVYAIPTAPPYIPIPLVQTPFRENNARVSPDGKWLAYLSDENGVSQLYVAPFMASGARIQISTAPAAVPQWSRDGRELYYVHSREEKWLMSVTIESDAHGLRAGAPQRLFSFASLWNYQVAGDGRFLVGRRSLNPDAPALTVVLNWRALLGE